MNRVRIRHKPTPDPRDAEIEKLQKQVASLEEMLKKEQIFGMEIVVTSMSGKAAYSIDLRLTDTRGELLNKVSFDGVVDSRSRKGRNVEHLTGARIRNFTERTPDIFLYKIR